MTLGEDQGALASGERREDLNLPQHGHNLAPTTGEGRDETVACELALQMGFNPTTTPRARVERGGLLSRDEQLAGLFVLSVHLDETLDVSNQVLETPAAGR